MYCYYRVQKHIDDETRDKAKAKLKSVLGEYDENEIKDLWKIYIKINIFLTLNYF